MWAFCVVSCVGIAVWKLYGILRGELCRNSYVDSVDAMEAVGEAVKAIEAVAAMEAAKSVEAVDKLCYTLELTVILQ